MFKHFVQPVRRFPYTHSASVRKASTILGASGRQYVRGEVLYKNEDGNPTIFKATRGNESVVLKQEPKSIFDLSQHLADEFAASRRLRIPIDFNREDHIVVYTYFTDTLLDLMRADPDFPLAELKKILRYIGEGIREFHAKDWLHLEGGKTVTDAALGDFGIAFKQVGATPLRTGTAIGNFIWRSPEAQTGSVMIKASDMFSYRLVCIYALGGGDLLLLEDKQVIKELAELGIRPYEDILTRHFAYFGPVNEGLLKQVDTREHSTLKKASAIAERAAENQPELRFEVWGKELGEAALDMISGLTKPDPTARRTIDQVLRSSWWQEP